MITEKRNHETEKTLVIGGRNVSYSEAINVICVYCHKFMDEDEECVCSDNFSELADLVMAMRLKLGSSENSQVKDVICRAYELYVEDMAMDNYEFAECFGMSMDELFDTVDGIILDADEF